MAFFLILLGVPLVFAAGAFVFLDGITWKEFGLIVLAQLIVAGSSASIVSCANTHDTEVWNGRIAKKYSERVSCEHSYPCNPHSCGCDSKGQNCSTCWDTCYEHFYDVSWRVVTSNNEMITIARVDRQGLMTPQLWATAAIGEPTSATHDYVNYIKAAPGTLFRHQGLKEKYRAALPPYSQRIYSYYRLDRFVARDIDVPESASSWNAALSELNADLGQAKQVNIIVVLVKDLPDDYFYALEEAWIGGKKNDVILVVSVTGTMVPQWARVMAWTSNELFKVKLRDDIMDDKVVTRESIMAALRTNVSQYYVRKPMRDFEYLKASIAPSLVEWIVTLIIGLLVAAGLTWFFKANDMFDEEERCSKPRWRRY